MKERVLSAPEREQLIDQLAIQASDGADEETAYDLVRVGHPGYNTFADEDLLQEYNNVFDESFFGEKDPG